MAILHAKHTDDFNWTKVKLIKKAPYSNNLNLANKFRFIIHCYLQTRFSLHFDAKMIILLYFYEALHHVEHWYVWLSKIAICAKLWVNQEANVSEHTFSSIQFIPKGSCHDFVQHDKHKEEYIQN